MRLACARGATAPRIISCDLVLSFVLFLKEVSQFFDKVSFMKRFFTFLGAIILLGALAGAYMWWYELTPMDFLRTPTGMLDESIYAAQQGDLRAFKRSFTRESFEYMDAMNDSNLNRDSGMRETDDASLFWTWKSLERKMAAQGGFEVLPESTKFYDYLFSSTAKVYILYYDKASKKDRQRAYTLRREKGVWRVDLKGNPDFVRAYYQSVREFRKDGATPPHERRKERGVLDNLL